MKEIRKKYLEGAQLSHRVLLCMASVFRRKDPQCRGSGSRFGVLIPGYRPSWEVVIRMMTADIENNFTCCFVVYLGYKSDLMLALP